MPAGGRIRIALPCYWAWGSIQVSDPREENYVEVSASNLSVEFIVWKKSEHSLCIKEPLLKEWKNVEKIKIPHELLSIDVAEVNSFCRNTDKFVLRGYAPMLYQRMCIWCLKHRTS